jgi:hypothetical protein
MPDEITTNEQTTTDATAITPATPAGATPTEPTQPVDNTVPYSRFDEVNKAKKAAESELAKLRKQAEDAESATLSEQNRFKELYEKEQAKAAALEKRFEDVQAQVTRDRIMAAIEAAARAADFADPADAHVFLDVNSIEVDEAGKVKEVETLVKSLAQAKPYLVAQREVQPGNGARPKPAGAAGTAAADEAARKQHGRWAHSQF